jgi:hypothetical protein
MDRSRTGVALGVALALLAGGCGRSALPIDHDGPAPPPDGRPEDARPREARAPDAIVDRALHDGGCPVDCKAACRLVVDCQLYPGDEAKCVAECSAVWGMAIKGCLAALVCGASRSCPAAATCVTSPPKPDLVPSELVTSVKGTAVGYSFKVCNVGAGAADPFGVDLYYHSPGAPAPKKPGDQAHKGQALAAGACAGFSLQRTGTPPGSYASWVRVDNAEVVAESDEKNNLAGPVIAVVQAPAQPDLVVKQLDAKVSGADVEYEAQVCNIGGATAFLFRVDIYWNRLLAPGPLQIGDQDALLFNLAAGACQSVKRKRTSAPVAIYSSWAQVDTLGTVPESNENNNVAGPKVVTVAAAPECAGLCVFATGCGVFKPLELQQCLSWCNQMSAAQRQCALAANKKSSCADLKACSLPPPPPPPPPPWACLNLCNYLEATCKALPGNNLVACLGACASLPASRLQCALDAMDKKQCAPILLCLL